MVVYQNPVKVSADNITAGPLSRTTGHLHVQAPRGIMIAALPIRVSVVRGLAKCFEYLEARFTGECDSQYDYSAQLKMFAAVRAFDPAFAREKGESFLAPALVDELKKCVPLLEPLATGMKQELPQFSVAVRDVTVNRADYLPSPRLFLTSGRAGRRRCPAGLRLPALFLLWLQAPQHANGSFPS
mmetsp:Transcript_22026/g.59407  ORF Transcript_22026/g.59407 Transcript_22026/m.59407 type:complete len:185 (+) Transcript_22026:267-821(+)